MKALLIDHDDSFTFNLQHWLSPLFADVEVLNHRDLKPGQSADVVLLSPGPHNPRHYPHMLEYLQKLPDSVYVYGVCLGLQMMVHSQGGRIESYSPPLHGKKSRLQILGSEYQHMNGLEVARYHSLKCNDIPDAFQVIATTGAETVPMWLKHTQKNWMGVQFHPESFLTAKADLHLQALKEWLPR